MFFSRKNIEIVQAYTLVERERERGPHIHIIDLSFVKVPTLYSKCNGCFWLVELKFCSVCLFILVVVFSTCIYKNIAQILLKFTNQAEATCDVWMDFYAQIYFLLIRINTLYPLKLLPPDIVLHSCCHQLPKLNLPATLHSLSHGDLLVSSHTVQVKPKT